MKGFSCICGVAAFSEWLNIIWMAFDMIGTIGLFANILRIKKLSIKRYYNPYKAKTLGGDPIATAFSDMTTQINGIIDDFNETSIRDHRNGLRWFWLILLGLTGQITLTLIQLLC